MSEASEGGKRHIIPYVVGYIIDLYNATSMGSESFAVWCVHIAVSAFAWARERERPSIEQVSFMCEM